MSSRRQAKQGGAGDAPIVQERHIVGPHGEDEIEANDDHGRPWYHLRPVPRRRTDLMGFNTLWWVLLWIIVIVIAVYPGPWW